MNENTDGWERSVNRVIKGVIADHTSTEWDQGK